MEMPAPPEDQELRNVIDKLAQFVARNGPEFEKMTMEKQKENPKFSFLFGGEFFNYYRYRLAFEQQPHSTRHDCEEYNLEVHCKQQDAPEPQPPLQTMAPPPLAAASPSLEELIQQSQWNLQQQEQHLHTLRQEQVSAAIALATEQFTQKLLLETQLDMSEFDSLLQPIIDTCTKDAISAGKNWMFNNAKTPQHCELMVGHLRNRITVEGAHFELRLHLIYLMNDVLHHCQRKQQRDLLAALQKVVVPIYCTSFLAVEVDKQQKIARLLHLWEKNGYFDEATIQQLQSPALGLGQYQASLITEYAAVVQPVQLAFQQQIQTLKTQHEEFVSSIKQQQQVVAAAQLGVAESEVRPATPGSAAARQPGDAKAALPVSGEYDSAEAGPQDPGAASTAARVPGDPIPTSKPNWFDPSHAIAAWGPQQQQQQPFEQPPFPPSQAPPPCPPWNSHEGLWNEQRDPNWNSQREATPWSSQSDSSWSSQYDTPWNNQPDQPPWGQREAPFRMQRPQHFRGPFPPHQQPPQFNQPPHPHNFTRFPPRFMQDDFPPRHHFDRPPYLPHRFDYPQGDFPGELGPPHHHPGHRIPPPGIGEHPPWGGPTHPDFGGPPPHGFNGQPPHMRRQGPAHVNHDDPSLVPNVPYFDLPAGLMAPLVKLEDHDYKSLDPKDIRLPPPMPPSDRLLAAVEAFYSPPSHDRPRNSEGWEQNGLYEFFRAKMRARRKKGQEKRNSARASLSHSRSRSRERSSSQSSSRSSKSSRSSSGSRSRSRSRSRSYSRSRSRSRSGSRSSRSGSQSRSGSRSRSLSPEKKKKKKRSKSRSPTPPSTSGLGAAPATLIPDQRLGEENKGHQMLMKMGWSGSGGLGVKEQGIQDPIKGGDVRDKWDQYKGVGVTLDDPYENYRRNKSYSFIARMKARDEVPVPQDPPDPPTQE
ncbi:calcium homeostasis endoplasmic reticulum protein-like isoform X1 [Polyodon spathula]|uniref:calcium homeostasis endoplasmic reticulum protein-like isoform X1 n=1 Tax=Polyodon spathula TaxID=7913 RepID=UPI001B7E2EB9|nr:calcium homeostasis endoplasmic reticulum protein-like isoform X1 [Polyodon spathula]